MKLFFSQLAVCTRYLSKKGKCCIVVVDKLNHICHHFRHDCNLQKKMVIELFRNGTDFWKVIPRNALCTIQIIDRLLLHSWKSQMHEVALERRISLWLCIEAILSGLKWVTDQYLFRGEIGFQNFQLRSENDWEKNFLMYNERFLLNSLGTGLIFFNYNIG